MIAPRYYKFFPPNSYFQSVDQMLKTKKIELFQKIREFKIIQTGLKVNKPILFTKNQNRNKQNGYLNNNQTQLWLYKNFHKKKLFF